MNDSRFQNIQTEQDDRGVLTVAFDVAGRPLNVFDRELLEELQQVLDQLEREDSIKFVVFKSAKETGFLAGADVRGIQTIETPQEAAAVAEVGQKLFDRIERLPMPTLAVIHGPCLGGGLEFALACRYRIARDDSKTRLGLPEVELGILPAWGGTQRLPKIVGLTTALTMILQAKKLTAKKAAKCGLVDKIALPGELDDAVRAFVDDRLAGRSLPQRKLSLPEKLRDHTRFGRWLIFKTVQKKLASRARHYPALPAALRAVERGIRRSNEAGFAEERLAISELLFTPTCRHLLGLFFQRERARNPASWVGSEQAEAALEAKPIRRVAVLGAGTMGAGIAQLLAFQGFEVVLKEVDQTLLDAGMERVRHLMNQAVRSGNLRSEEAEARLAAIQPTVDWEPFAEIDLAIEAVTERKEVKQAVFKELDERMPADAIIVSNTSALSVDELAQSTKRPDRVAGLHFFNPVHRMHLIEVVRTSSVNEQTIALLIGLVRRLGKTPIVVTDSPGFLVNRILFPYLDEAVRMVCEGVPADRIDRDVRQFGMPMGPLELLDQVGIDLAADVAKSLSPLSADSASTPTPTRLAAMAEKGWLGVKSGHGFYHYKGGQRQKPTTWESAESQTVPDLHPVGEVPPDAEMTGIQERLIYLFINEASRCLEERIVTDAWMVDLGMVLGTGFAPFRGGPLRMADEWGIDRIVRNLEKLRETYGQRFAPTTLLQEMEQQQDHFFRSVENSEEPSARIVEARATAS